MVTFFGSVNLACMSCLICFSPLKFSSILPGIFWKVKNNKYIACSFGPDSVAKRVGVRPGDILRSVDGVDILGFQMDDSVRQLDVFHLEHAGCIMLTPH